MADHFRSVPLGENVLARLEIQDENQDEPCIIDESTVVVVSSTPPTDFAEGSVDVVKTTKILKARVPASRSAVKKVPKAVPNHFFAVQISDSQILDAVGTLQSVIVEREPLLGTTLVAPSTLHITLAVAHLSCTEEIDRANQVLEDSVKKLSAVLQSPCLHIHLAQVGHFNNKVIYASVQEESDGVNHLRFLWQSLRDGCQAAGIKLVDGDRFTPHMTILKLSKDPKIFRKGIKAVAPHLYETHVDCIFGRQVIESVQLLSMTEPKDDKGYYTLKGEYHFSPEVRRTAADVAAEAKDEARLKMRQLLLRTNDRLNENVGDASGT